jgi:hypothetical protein
VERARGERLDERGVGGLGGAESADPEELLRAEPEQLAERAARREETAVDPGEHEPPWRAIRDERVELRVGDGDVRLRSRAGGGALLDGRIHGAGACTIRSTLRRVRGGPESPKYAVKSACARPHMDGASGANDTQG